MNWKVSFLQIFANGSYEKISFNFWYESWIQPYELKFIVKMNKQIEVFKMQ